MRISNVVISFAVSGLLCGASAAQTPSTAPAASPAPTESPAASAAAPTAPSSAAATTPASPAAAPAGPALPSGLLLPSLTNVQQTLTALKLEKWKRGTVRDEAGDNVSEVLRDIKSTLPELMKTADSGPEAVSKTLPLSRNLGALYDVMLRIYEASRVAAPADQVTQIQQTLGGLKKARLALDDHLQQSADAADKQVSELQVTVQKQALALHAVTPAPPPPACVPPAPKPAVKPKRKPGLPRRLQHGHETTGNDCATFHDGQAYELNCATLSNRRLMLNVVRDSDAEAFWIDCVALRTRVDVRPELMFVVSTHPEMAVGTGFESQARSVNCARLMPVLDVRVVPIDTAFAHDEFAVRADALKMVPRVNQASAVRVQPVIGRLGRRSANAEIRASVSMPNPLRAGIMKFGCQSDHRVPPSMRLPPQSTL